MITTEQLVLDHEFKQLTCLDKTIDIQGAYIGDLLSWVMGHAQANQAWITIIGHVNSVAVACLHDLACIILVEDAPVLEETLMKAEQEGLIILKTSRSAYHTAIALHQLGVK
jgi:hypothetical protein